jgi:hypothetical protein
MWVKIHCEPSKPVSVLKIHFPLECQVQGFAFDIWRKEAEGAEAPVTSRMWREAWDRRRAEPAYRGHPGMCANGQVKSLVFIW